MANLTEEQLDEFLQALAPLAKGMMAGAVKVGAKAKPIATAMAKQGKALGKVDAIAKAKPKVSPGQLSLDLKGKGGMSPDTPSSVATGRMSPRRADTKSGNLVGDELKRQATATVVNKAVSGGGGGQKERAKNISASADLFDIVKGQLLDEGLSEEEIKDIMLTLTPDEILSEVTAEFVLDASKRASAKSTMLGSQGDKQGMMDKAAQAKRLYDKSAEKRRAGNYKQGATPQGPSRIPTGEA